MATKDPHSRVEKVEQILCAQCKCPTSHTIKGSHESSWSIDEADISGGGTHDLLACNGCGSVTYREKSWSTEEQVSTTTLYPPRGASDTRQPKTFNGLPYGGPLESVYRQSISAFNQQLPILTGAGVRLLIEGICNDRGIKDGEIFDSKTGALVVGKKSGKPARKDSLEGKINGLVEQGLVARNQATTLHEIRVLGNDAAHELDQPSRKVLSTALDIVEHILAQIYEQPEHTRTLAARKRPAKQKSPDS